MAGAGTGTAHAPAGPCRRGLPGLGRQSLYQKPTLMPKMGPTKWSTT